MDLSVLFNAEKRKHITNTIFTEMVRCKADVGIVLGARGLTEIVADTAADAFHGVSENDKPFDKIITTGGNTTKQMGVYYAAKFCRMKPEKSHFEHDIIEADAINNRLLNRGISQSHIVYTDREAENTGDNFENTASFIKGEGYKSVAIICLGYQQTRAYQTAKRHMPDVKFTTIGVYPWRSREKWMNGWHYNLIGGAVVLSEYSKIDPNNPKNYYNRGFAINTPIPNRLKLQNFRN